jgi:Rad3-related DNA helicase
LCTAKSQLPPLSRLLSSDDRIAQRLFVQKEGASRADLLERFKNTGGGILIGLASFWEGVDLPGDLLEILLILKLPFLVPTEPVVQARSRRLGDAGEDPFVKLFLPDVVLKLRQGIGRLIRTGSDRGVVIILDSRLRHGSYGKLVLDASAGCYEIFDDGKKLIERIKERI